MRHLISRPDRPIRARALVLAACLLAVGAAQAAVVDDAGVPEPAALVCPVLPASPPKPPPTRPAPPPEPAQPLEPDALPTPLPDLTSLEPLPQWPLRKTWRIGLWGDSHTAAGFLSEGLIQGLGLSADEVGSSFIPASFGLPGVRLPIRKSCVGPGWGRTHAFRTKAAGAVLPKSLVQGKTTDSDSYVWLDVRTTARPQGLAALDVQFSPPDGMRANNTVLAVSLNDAPERIVALDRRTDRLLALRSAHGIQTVKLRLISGDLALDGLVPHHATPPKLVLDTFGIPGATARGWEIINPAALTAPGAPSAPGISGTQGSSGTPGEGDADSAYDMVVLAYGTNEGSDSGYDPTKYATSLRTGLRNLRSVYPQAACMLLGPTDRGIPVRRSASGATSRTQPPRLYPQHPLHPLHYARIHRSISEVQQRVGAEFGCRFWDWQSFMGGPGGAYRWLTQTPPLMAPDLIHLTVQGYRTSGQRLGALLRGR